MIRLYRADWSTNCERVALALAYKRIEPESVVIDYADRSIVEQVSGQGLVPVIEGQVVADSTHILLRNHLFGDDFSAADCAAFPFLKYAAYRDPADDEPFQAILEEHQGIEGRPNLAAWIERVDERPRA